MTSKVTVLRQASKMSKLDVLMVLKEKAASSMTEKERNELVAFAKTFEEEFQEKFEIQRYIDLFSAYYQRKQKIQAYATSHEAPQLAEKKYHTWYPEEKELLLLYAQELPPDIPFTKGLAQLANLLGIQANRLIQSYYRFTKENFGQKKSELHVFQNENKHEEVPTIFGYPVTIQKTTHSKNGKDIWLVSFKDTIPKDIFADIKLVMQSNQGKYYTKRSSLVHLRSKFVFFKEPTFFDSKVIVKKLDNTLIRKEKDSEYQALEKRLLLVEQKMNEILERVKAKAV